MSDDAHWSRQLEVDQIVLIDGATGTELQRRGVPIRYGYHVARAGGERAVEEVRIARLDESGRLRRESEDLRRGGSC